MAHRSTAHRSWIASGYLVVLLAFGLTESVRSESLPVTVRTCRSEADDTQRLRCYDAAVDAATPASTAVVPLGGVTSKRQPVTSVPADVTVRDSSAVATVPAKAAPSRLPMFSATVAALSFRPSGAVNVTLDNGQVWSQYGPEGRVPLQTGDRITLRPGLFGASVLVAPSGWITKVRLIPTLGADARDQ